MFGFSNWLIGYTNTLGCDFWATCGLIFIGSSLWPLLSLPNTLVKYGTPFYAPDAEVVPPRTNVSKGTSKNGTPPPSPGMLPAGAAAFGDSVHPPQSHQTHITPSQETLPQSIFTR